MDKLVQKLNEIQDLLKAIPSPKLAKPSTKQAPISAPSAPSAVGTPSAAPQQPSLVPQNKADPSHVARHQAAPVKEIAQSAAESLEYNKLGQWKLNSQPITKPSLSNALPKNQTTSKLTQT